MADSKEGVNMLTSPRQPVLDLVGTWTASSGINMTVYAGATPYSYSYTRSEPGTTEEGYLVVLDVDGDHQKIDQYVRLHPTNVLATASDPVHYPGSFNPETGVLTIDGVTFVVTSTPASQEIVLN